MYIHKKIQGDDIQQCIIIKFFILICVTNISQMNYIKLFILILFKYTFINSMYMIFKPYKTNQMT